MVGQTISHYKITEKLGEAGMGTVVSWNDPEVLNPKAEPPYQ